MQDFNSYKINEAFSHRYYKIPQELFVNPLYKDTLNSDSKLLYGFILDRMSLSVKNNWCDEDGNIYLIFTKKEVQEKLGLCDRTVTKAFKQLSNAKLIYEKRQGANKPNLDNNFDLERGTSSERVHLSVEDYKKVTNFENTKTFLKDIKLELPETPNINDFGKFMRNRDKKIQELVINPRDKIIKNLQEENSLLYFNLERQVKTVEKASKYEKETKSILAENQELKEKCENIENEYYDKLKNEIRKVENKYEDEIYHLEKENNF